MKIQQGCCDYVAAVIRNQRQKRKLAQGEIARSIGQKQSWLSRLEGGQQRICVYEFLILAEAIGFDPFKALHKIERRRKKSRMDQSADFQKTRKIL